jgi:RNA polymerase sigma-70 factor (sigma-E family)
MDDDADFAAFYAACRPRLVTILAALTGNLTEAEDVVQEAFTRALPRWGRLREYDDAEAWVYRVASNLARSRWRRSLRVVTDYGADTHRAAGELSPDRVALVAALRALPLEQREALVLFHIADLSVDDIARRLELPAGTVKARLSRGRRAMAQLLAPLDKVTAHD